ncbi:hypothetical protein Tco_1242895 [Tanacetum coccineum]
MIIGFEAYHELEENRHWKPNQVAKAMVSIVDKEQNNDNQKRAKSRQPRDSFQSDHEANQNQAAKARDALTSYLLRYIVILNSLPKGDYSPSVHHANVIKDIVNPNFARKSLQRSFGRRMLKSKLGDGGSWENGYHLSLQLSP